jgi:hypothetical protein
MYSASDTRRLYPSLRTLQPQDDAIENARVITTQSNQLQSTPINLSITYNNSFHLSNRVRLLHLNFKFPSFEGLY